MDFFILPESLVTCFVGVALALALASAHVVLLKVAAMHTQIAALLAGDSAGAGGDVTALRSPQISDGIIPKLNYLLN